MVNQTLRRSSVLAEAVVTFALAAAIVFVIVFTLRSGPLDKPWSVFHVFLFAIAPLLVSASLFGNTASWSISRLLALTITSLATLYLPASGLLVGPWAVILAVLPIAAFGYWWTQNVPFPSWTSVFQILITSVFLAAFILALGSAAKYLLPESASLGMAHPDHLYHATIAQMIKKHGYPSLGGDGLEYHAYHFASHVVAAGLSRATDINVLTAYVYWGTLALKLQFLWFIFVSIILLTDAKYLTNTSIYHVVIYSAVALYLVGSGSESYLLASAMFLAMLPLLCALLSVRSDSIKHFRLAHFFALAVAFICAASKTSLGFYCAICFTWIAVQNRRNVGLFLGTFVGLTVLAIVTVLFLSETAHLLPLKMLRDSYAQYLTPTTILSYALPIVLLTLIVIKPRLGVSAQDNERQLCFSWSLPTIDQRTSSGLFTALVNADGRIQVIVVMTLSCLAVLFTLPIGSNIAYFSLPLLTVAVVLAPQIFTQFLAFNVFSIGKRMLFVVAIFLLIITSAFEFQAKIIREVGRYVDRAFIVDKSSRLPPGTLTGKKLARKQLVSSFFNEGQPLKPLRDRIGASGWGGVVRYIREVNRQQLTAVHVPVGNEVFWRRLSRDSAYWCMTPHLMIPAETGAFQIKSVAPLHVEKLCSWGGFTFYGYGKAQDQHRSANQTILALCREASLLGVKRVYVLNSIDRLSDNTMTTCSDVL